jgi:hypothetical protein
MQVFARNLKVCSNNLKQMKVRMDQKRESAVSNRRKHLNGSRGVRQHRETVIRHQQNLNNKSGFESEKPLDAVYERRKKTSMLNEKRSGRTIKCIRAQPGV